MAVAARPLTGVAVVGCEGRWETFQSKCSGHHNLHSHEGFRVQKQSLKPPAAQPIIMILTVQLQFIKHTTPCGAGSAQGFFLRSVFRSCRVHVETTLDSQRSFFFFYRNIQRTGPTCCSLSPELRAEASLSVVYWVFSLDCVKMGVDFRNVAPLKLFWLPDARTLNSALRTQITLWMLDCL